MQSHNRILRAAASGDVAALRHIVRETDPVLIAAVQNKVWCHDSIQDHVMNTRQILCSLYKYCVFFRSMDGEQCISLPSMVILTCWENCWRCTTVKQTRGIRWMRLSSKRSTVVITNLLISHIDWYYPTVFLNTIAQVDPPVCSCMEWTYKNCPVLDGRERLQSCSCDYSE